jgi:dipeptidyl aminopeptidase/acylaminoacyl peptidase
MNRLGSLVVGVLIFCSIEGHALGAAENGTLVEQTKCESDSSRTYDQYLTTARQQGHGGAPELTRAQFERRVAYEGFECHRIRYVSDGLQVVGYIWKPKHSGQTRMPLIIFNRGGNRERSRLTPWMADGFHDFVSAGFVVIASQYRGVDGGEGKEEYGGADVQDVLSLFPLARALGYVDMENVFMFGNSRGGMMTYLALKAGAPVRAAAVMSGVANLVGNAVDHPQLVETVYQQLIPDYDTRGDEALRERSVVYWAERVNVPLLLLHGGADQQIAASRTLELAQKLQALGKPYELIVYAGDDHGLSRNKADRDRRVLAWFQRHMTSAD